MSSKKDETENPHAGNVDENIATAREMHHTHGQPIEQVAKWLSDTTGGAVSVEDAIEHIVVKEE